MTIDFNLKRTFSKALTDAHLLDLPEKIVGKKFLFDYELGPGKHGLLCGDIRGIEYSPDVGLHLFVSCPGLDVSRLKSLYWNPETSGWIAIIETDRAELLGHFMQGSSGLAPNCVPGRLEVQY